MVRKLDKALEKKKLSAKKTHHNYHKPLYVKNIKGIAPNSFSELSMYLALSEIIHAKHLLQLKIETLLLPFYSLEIEIQTGILISTQSSHS